MSERCTDDRVWRDAQGTPIPVDAWVEQIEVDAELGALRSRLGKRGRVLRRSATRLVVRFEGETALTRTAGSGFRSDAAGGAQPTLASRSTVGLGHATLHRSISTAAHRSNSNSTSARLRRDFAIPAAQLINDRLRDKLG